MHCQIKSTSSSPSDNNNGKMINNTIDSTDLKDEHILLDAEYKDKINSKYGLDLGTLLSPINKSLEYVTKEFLKIVQREWRKKQMLSIKVNVDCICFFLHSLNSKVCTI